MAGVLVSASTEVMNSILEKLASLMTDESTKLIGVHKQLQFLHDELSSMRAFLEDVDDGEGSSKQTTVWRNEVRELAYDIEDCIDDFRQRVVGRHDGQGLIHKAVHLLKTLMARYQIATKIKEFKTRVQDASDRRTRYRLDESSSRPAHVTIDPRITALYVQTSSLVGIDGPKEEVIKLLTKVDDMSEQELNVVSIVGFGGLGKTTLANEVYRWLAGGALYAYPPVILMNFTCTLSSLKISVVELCMDDVAALAGLPILAHLILEARNVPGEGLLFSSGTGTTFKVLGYIRIPYVGEAGITFEAGSMPQVKTIRFTLTADDVKRHGVKIIGIEQLPNLHKVHVNLRYGSDLDDNGRTRQPPLTRREQGHEGLVNIDEAVDDRCGNRVPMRT
ncbi:hypothetical protein PR202_ga07942 [Eleusine coracana subsp. coracana]|uniref:Rx N-terminal domain-containing protein n=1 Tax=Eleusine coracana subsp. coracana TaxID=191504 RepID=A0AAV5BZ34_ELECO|nr:hypothetical protein PR202_ga07942 [Eleusine coracana subsp. coracana]